MTPPTHTDTHTLSETFVFVTVIVDFTVTFLLKKIFSDRAGGERDVDGDRPCSEPHVRSSVDTSFFSVQYFFFFFSWRLVNLFILFYLSGSLSSDNYPHQSQILISISQNSPAVRALAKSLLCLINECDLPLLTAHFCGFHSNLNSVPLCQTIE